MITQKHSYVTSDGRSFDNEHLAHRHERAYRLRHFPHQPIMQDPDDKWIAYSEAVVKIIAETKYAVVPQQQ